MCFLLMSTSRRNNMILIEDTKASYDVLATEILSACLSSDDNVAGIKIPDTNYVASFRVVEQGEDTYEFKDFLISLEDNEVIAVDEDTSDEDYSSFEVHMLIQSRLSKIDLDDAD